MVIFTSLFDFFRIHFFEIDRFTFNEKLNNGAQHQDRLLVSSIIKQTMIHNFKDFITLSTTLYNDHKFFTILVMDQDTKPSLTS